MSTYEIGTTELYRGDQFRFRLSVIDTNNLPVDLTGYTVRMKGKVSAGGSGPVAMVATGTVASPASGGIALCEMSPETTLTLPLGLIYFNIRMTPPNGEVFTVCKGSINVLESLAPGQ